MRIAVRKSRRRSERIVLNLASMIDVIFLLLIYFMVTSAFARPEDRLSPTLQTQTDAATSEGADFERQVLQVAARETGPAYVLNGRVIPDRAALEAELRRLNIPSGLYVQVDDGVPVGFAVAAIQSARDAGFIQVTYVPPR